MKSIKRFVVSASVAIALSGCHSAYDSGLDKLASGEFSAAAKFAEEGLKENPNDPELNLLMAEALVGDQQYAPAEPYARKAFKAPDFKAPAGRTLGKILWELGQPVGAVEVWKVAREAQKDVVSDDDYVRGLEIAIATATSIHEFSRAIDLTNELTAYRPEHPSVQPGVLRKLRESEAEEFVRNGELQKGVDAYLALAQDYNDAIYHFERGWALMMLNDPNAATLALEQYVQAAPTSERADRAVAVAERAERANKHATAIVFYDKALQLMEEKASARRASVHLELGALLVGSRAVDQGREQFAAYIEQMASLHGRPVSPDRYLKVANLALDNRAPELAITFLEDGIANSTPMWTLTMKLAELYARRARNADVERVLKAFVDASSNKNLAQLQAGRWASGRRNYELAVFFLESAVSDKNADEALAFELARTYAAVGRLEDMRRSLETYVKLSNNSVSALTGAAGLYRAQRMYEQAETTLLKAFKTAADIGTVQELEVLYREWGKDKKIHDIWDKYIKARGSKPEDFAMVGGRFMRQNAWEDALPYLRQAASRGDKGAWLQIADVYKRQRKERDMKEALAKYLAEAPNREQALEEIWQRYRTSQWNHEAIPVLEELVALQPTNVVYYEELSELYFAQGRDVEAFELWKKYLANSRDPVIALESMARRFERRGHDEWMLALLEKMAERDGEARPELYRLLGDAHYAAAQRRGRIQLERDENVIFSAEDRARTYYRKFLTSAKPSTRELRAFADGLRIKRLWDVAAAAYERLDVENGEGTDELLAYGTVLLNLGRPQDATRVLDTFYVRRDKSVEAARQVVEALAPAKQFVAMEPYLKRMMESGDENLLRNAFLQLSEAYRQTDRTKDVAQLINTYLGKTQNPTEARRTILVVLESSGMWDEGVRQLERIVDLEGEETRYELARMYFRAGRTEEAEAAFRNYASNSVAQGEAWWRVAAFYEGHADTRNAEDAFNAAVAASPKNDNLMTERARFRVVTGRVEDGRQDFEAARAMVDHARKGGIWRVEVDALLQIGHYALAREAARAALQVAYMDRDYFARVAAAVELASGDAARAQRFVDEIKSGGLPTEVIVELLVDHKHLEAAASVIETEIREGDYNLGGDLALTHADVFTALGGVDRFLRTIQPLYDRGRDGRILGRVGQYLALEGQNEQAALHLRAAVDQGSTQYRPLLVQTYLLLGHRDEAARQLQTLLLESPEADQPKILASQAPMFEVLGLRSELRSLLEQFAADARFRTYAAPMLIHMLAEEGQTQAAMDVVIGAWSGLRADAQSLPSGDSDVLRIADVTVGMLGALAAEGLLPEAAALLGAMPEQLRNQDSVRDFELRLAALRGEPGKALVDAALSDLGVSTADQLKRLKIAQLKAFTSDPEGARAIAEPLLTAGDFDVAREALRTVFAASRIEHDLSRNAGWAKTFIDSRADKAGARATAADLARIIADDKLLTELANKTLALVPTDSNIRLAIHNAQVSGDLKLFEKASRRYWQVAGEPVAEVATYIETFSERHDPEYVEALLGDYHAAFPDNLLARWSLIKMHYRQGDVDRAREELLNYLDAVNWDSQAVHEALRGLATWRLWGEMARVVGPKIPTDAVSTPILYELGRANLYLGFKDTGVSALDQYIAGSADGASAASELAVELLEYGHPQQALRYAELAIQKRPGRSRGYLVRGMARIALGEDAADDIDRGLTDGAGRVLALYRIGKFALQANRKDLAERYLEQLVRTPRGGDGASWVPLALDAYRSTNKAAEGVEFVEKRWPELAAGIGVSANEVVPSLASLYEGAGLVERVFSLYEEGIRAEFVSAPFTGDLPTYRNNLAYVYSTANRHIEEGMNLIGLAMAADPRRNASFIDTLGWLHYREGDISKAYDEVERALRSSSGSASELVELYEHLAELEELKGRARRASWLRVFADLIRNR